ncbi:MAG: TlpA family protein disulfide reductase [Cellvibrionaceae bacterium]|nr:TlpA family protein disulfide reductase [Cellvibrionaceae bacterium]
MKRITTLIFACLFSLSMQAKELSGPAPDFTLTSIDGEKVKLSDLKGQVVMINFWASWCGPCRQEMPLLNDIYAGYKKAGFVLLSINLDESTDDAKAFLKKTPVNFPVLLDSKGKVADLYKNQAMPSSYFVDRKGNLVHLHQGYKPGEEAEYKRVIKKLLAQ